MKQLLYTAHNKALLDLYFCRNANFLELTNNNRKHISLKILFTQFLLGRLTCSNFKIFRIPESEAEITWRNVIEHMTKTVNFGFRLAVSIYLFYSIF